MKELNNDKNEVVIFEINDEVVFDTALATLQLSISPRH